MRLLRALALLVIGCLLVGARPARADNTADEADVAFALGNRAYRDGHFEEALADYFRSYRLVANPNVLFNIARCWEALGKFDQAYRYYTDLSTRPLAKGDLREVKRALARMRPRVALVDVTTSPPGADVFIDRVDLGSHGKSPRVLAMPPGRHRVIVRLAGHHETKAAVRAVRGSSLRLALSLPPLLGKVALAGSPKGAVVRTAPEGPVVGRIPGTLSLPVGAQRVLYVSAEGYLPAQLLVDVAEDAEAHAHVALVPRPPPTGKVVVTANRQSALVRVDGRQAGFTPVVLTLPVGAHALTVSTSEVSPVERTVQVEAGKTVKLDASLYYRPPPVKAASKSLVSVDEAPASVTVLTREELQAFGYRTLAEALGAVRGIYLSDDRQYTYVGIRGFSPPGDLNTRILILWDGHAMNDAWAGQGYAARDLSVDLDEVDRIEVVRGPGSALYGTGAFFAVINVVPRDALPRGEHASLTGAVGGEGGWALHATGNLRGDGFSLMASGSIFEAQGARLTDLGPLGTVTGLDGERAYDASVRARKGPWTLMAKINRRSKDIPSAAYQTGPGLSGTSVNDSRGFAELRWEHTVGKGFLSLRGYYDASRYRGFWAYTGASGDPSGRSLLKDSGEADWVGLEARYRFGLLGTQLTLGLAGQKQLRVRQGVFGLGDTPVLGTQTRTQLSLYALDAWRISSRVRLSAGLRVDHYLDLSKTPVTPRLALILRPYARGVTKLVAGQAFRVPDVYELYYGDGNLTERPALSLQPETITTFEVEHSHDVTEELRLTVSAYYNRIQHLIVLGQEDAPTPLCGTASTPAQCLVYQNADGALTAAGAEAELRWQPGRYALVDLSYAFVALSGKFTEIEATSPHHLAIGRILVPLRDALRLSVEARYQSARVGPRTPLGAGEALLLNAGISGRVGHLRYFAGVKNLLDTRYGDPVGSEFAEPTVPQYGRTFWIQLTGSL